MRKLLYLTAFLLSVCSTSLFAKTAKEQPENFEGGYTIGLTTSNNFIGILSGYYLTTGYIHPKFSFDFGVNYFHIHERVDYYPEILNFHDDYFSAIAHIGPRNRIYNNLFVNYGLTSTYYLSIEHKKNTYSVGLYTGLDLQITKHFLLSGKVYPFSFIHPTSGYRIYKAFGSGTLGTSYVF